MQVDRGCETVSFQGENKGAEPGESPVREVLREAEARLQGGGAVSVEEREWEAFDRAEAAWLAALAACRSLPAPVSDGDQVAGGGLLECERRAALNFATTPLPALQSMPRKLWMIEMAAYEVAHHGADGGDLAVWLSALRLDLMRLLPRTTPLP